ncbi:MAG TPA: hypothetical protein VNE60_08005 [Gemmatimonadaceae bacterium]|nr:hypothetical protein [Gemmatimonadaceae bacterium]
MSRAFVNEDANEPEPRYVLPPRDDPGYDDAAAQALLDGANVGNSYGAEQATGYAWGEEKLKPIVTRIRDRAAREGDERMATLAQRFLRQGPTR